MKKTILILGALVGVGIVAALGLALLQPVHTANGGNEAVRLYLPRECTYDALRDTLDTHGIVPCGTLASSLFNVEAHLLDLDRGVCPGSYLVPAHMDILALVRKLRNGQQDPIRLTIGKHRLPYQLGAYLDAKLMYDGFEVPLDSFHLVLPDTYEVYWTITPAQFLQRMEREYDAFWSLRRLPSAQPDANTAATAAALTPRDIVILASIVEEETNYGPEKPLIASVYLNRLRCGMPLQADPTVKYAVGDFGLRRVLNKHLAVESPFNTYLHAGLPPAPICLPSKATIQAVIDAPATDHLYFCASPQLDGTHRFAATLAEHNRNANAYHKAIANL